MTSDLDFMTALDLRRLIATRAVSPVELTERALARAEASQATLNAFCLLMPDEARAAARRAEDAVMRGAPLGLLHGLPVSVKDLIAVGGQPYASGSRAMADNVAAADAPSVERLRAAGAVIIGKTTTSEFGAKPVGDSPLTGITRHPWDLTKTPGGSSAGAAASVAAGITPFALGTDGGGSLRIPAALTGLVGLKAQFGRVPVWPTSATPTLAHVGALGPLLGDGPGTGEARPVANPADGADIVGRVVEADARTVEAALVQAASADWALRPPDARAAILERAADRMEAEPHALLALMIREAGKSLPNAIAELREAIDFLRAYAGEVRRDFANDTHRPLGPVACISPWNFPLAIFTGQVAAALAAGNPVLAKPAEETPLTAARAVAILRAAGVPPDALQLLPGDGAVGARLVADARVCGVMFTGSTEVAKRIQAALAGRLGPDGRPVPLVAETGGLNAMVVDSSALPEQVVADVLASAFDSAGQRCSALRVLCLQAEIADRVLAMLKGAMAELRVGDPARLATDVGPVISETARTGILDHVARMRARGRPVHAPSLPPETAAGHFVAPTLVEVADLAALEREVFGPVLHVLRYAAAGLDALLAGIAATGYGLTFGAHSRIDAAARRMADAAEAGNIYVNRNMIGAVVGTQPFGGAGLSGTGPKAGGPLYLRRLLAACPGETGLAADAPIPAPLRDLRDALRREGRTAEAALAERTAAHSPLGHGALLPGPVGEENRYDLLPRGTILCLPLTEAGLHAQLAAALATGNRVRLCARDVLRSRVADLPESVRTVIDLSDAPDPAGCAAVLAEAEGAALEAVLHAVAEGAPAVIPVHTAVDGLYPTGWLLRERSLSINTAAAGGNASLMALG
ncbi:L-glutamate gamma-semialdehyde dehydrogenase [Methylobacterium hispanicum]|uniref:L-glutamate gamma-semialdehyde dehydrogenase n=1 Tax=Methylobacterium hispanicum TaxID=270350 RepID=UPI002F360B9F